MRSLQFDATYWQISPTDELVGMMHSCGADDIGVIIPRAIPNAKMLLFSGEFGTKRSRGAQRVEQ